MTTQEGTTNDTGAGPDLAGQLAGATAQIAALRAELAQAKAQRSPAGAMGAAPDGAESKRVQAARAAAQSGDRGALLAYLRVRRQPAD